jgi:hypothetical protein
LKLSAGDEVAHPVRHGLARRGEVIEQGFWFSWVMRRKVSRSAAEVS